MGKVCLESHFARQSRVMQELASIVRNTCRTPAAGPEAPTFDIVTTLNATQRHALDLIKQIRP